MTFTYNNYRQETVEKAQELMFDYNLLDTGLQFEEIIEKVIEMERNEIDENEAIALLEEIEYDSEWF